MAFAIGMRLAEATREHLGLVALVIAVAVVILVWPRIAQRIEDWLRRR